MKKTTLLFFGFVFISLYSTKVNSQTTVYDLKEDFTTDVSNWGFTTNVGTQTNTYNATSKLLQIRWGNASSEYIKTLSTTITPGTDNKVTVDLIIKAYTSGSSSNEGVLYFLDESGNAITGFHVRRTSVGGSNKWAIGRATSYLGTTFAYPSNADALNADQPTARITFILDFNAKTLDFSALQGTFDYSTRVFTASGATISSTAQPFINIAATNIMKLSSWYWRGSTASGTNGFDLMYAGISASRAVSTASVTVNYLDPSGNPIKTARVATENVVGSTYAALLDDKATFVDGGFYYVYDPASTTADNVVVLLDGTAVINLKFIKTAVNSGTYTWTGSSSTNWNETETNFSTDGTNSVGYQFGNAVVFGATAVNKSVSLNSVFNLGSNDVTISSDGYSFEGSGRLTGTGKIILNTTGTTTLNIINELTGGVDVNGGIAVIAKDAAATKLTVANGSTLNLSTGSAFNKAIAATGTLNIVPTSNVWYTSAITGGTSLHYNIVSVGAVSTSAFSALPVLNNTFGGDIYVATSEASAFFGTTISYTSNKLALGDNISLVYPQNPAADGSTAIAIGELSGTSLSKLMGNRIGRVVTYTIGNLNTDFTFDGTIENFGPDAWAGIPVTNLTKTGTGTMTLTGNSSLFTTGAVVVSNGKLAVNGKLGTTTVPVTVAAAGTLKGTGTVNGATTVNGTLEGRLNFGSSLTLVDTTNLVVDGFAATQYDSITVVGAVTMGGVLNVTVNAAAPAVNTSIKLIKAGSYTGSFTTKNLPSNYTFDAATGILTYDLGTKLSSEFTNKLSIYPTLTHDFVNISGVNASTVELVNLTGQTVKQVSLSNGKTTINMIGLATGAYFVKVRSTDGSVNVQKVIYQK